jgi:uncharacterized Zn finger protein
MQSCEYCGSTDCELVTRGDYGTRPLYDCHTCGQTFRRTSELGGF